MCAKIWRFDVLVNDCFINFNPDRIKITPDENDFLLSVVNGFEDGHWMANNFQQFIFNNIALTALNSEERAKCVDCSFTALTEAAKHLRIPEQSNSRDKGIGSEVAEIVLYGIMKLHYGAIPAIPKIFYKQNDNDNAKGADAVHIVLTNDGDFQLWLGEAKFYNNLENVRMDEPISSVEQMLKTPIIRKEVGMVTSLKDLDDEIEDCNLLKTIKETLANGVSIDVIKAHIHVPILLLHQCDITASSSKLDDAYKQSIINSHKKKAETFFAKQINKLGELSGYEDINFHLILFPVPNKKEIVNSFLDTAKNFRKNAGN